jgi:RNA polymerase sigma-70 factor (ECF subfamily)
VTFSLKKVVQLFDAATFGHIAKRIEQSPLGAWMSTQVDPGQFIELYAAHEVRLRGYVLSLVPRWSDAEDIAQQSSLILWKKFDQYETGTNFFAWACQIVRFEVRAYSRRVARDRKVFSEEFVNAVMEQTVQSRTELQDRTKALQKCVEKLPTAHRELLRLRYDEQRSVGSVATILNRPIEAVYKALSRIRQTLYTCIRRRLVQG